MAAMPAKGHRAIALSLALSLLAACGGYAPARVVEPRLTQAPAPRGSALLKTVMLRGHNDARGALGLPPLAWDDSLADAARAYAGDMARTGRFAHAEQPQGLGRQGENLWTGTRDAYRYDEMLGHWLAEQRDYVNLPTPGFSRTGRWQDVSHYSEIVWRGARRMGCALVPGRHNDFLVCRYSPPGNVVGETAY